MVQKLWWTQDTLLRWISILCKVWYVFQLLVPHYFDTYILSLLPWPPNHLIFLSIKSRVPRCNRGFRSFFFWDSDALHILCSLSLCSRALLECSKYLIGKGRRLLVLTVVKHTWRIYVYVLLNAVMKSEISDSYSSVQSQKFLTSPLQHCSSWRLVNC